MNSYILTLARKAKKSQISYRQGELNNIAVCATIRGGSTLLADMLAAQRGMWFSDEPFALRNRQYLGPLLQKKIKIHSNKDCRFFDLSDSETKEFISYTKKINKLKIRPGTSRKTKIFLRADRACFKILRCSWLVDTFESQGMQVLFIVRHPAAQSLSVMRLGWQYSAEIYFQRIDFLAQYFSGDQIDYGLRILSEGSDFQKAVLSWICDVIYPLKFSNKISSKIFYEDLISQKENSIDNLCSQFSLYEPAAMKRILSQPSGSSIFSTGDINKKITVGDSNSLLSEWCKYLDESERELGQEVLECFDVGIYSMYSTTPIR